MTNIAVAVTAIIISTNSVPFIQHVDRSVIGTDGSSNSVVLESPTRNQKQIPVSVSREFVMSMVSAEEVEYLYSVIKTEPIKVEADPKWYFYGQLMTNGITEVIVKEARRTAPPVKIPKPEPVEVPEPEIEPTITSKMVPNLVNPEEDAE